MRFLINVKTDEFIKNATEQFEALRESHKSRFLFLKKQVDDLNGEGAKNHNEYWASVETRMRDLGVLSDEFYNQEKDIIRHSMESGDFFIEKDHKCEHPMKDFIKKLME